MISMFECDRVLGTTTVWRVAPIQPFARVAGESRNEKLRPGPGPAPVQRAISGYETRHRERRSDRYEEAFQKMLTRESGKVVLRISRD